MCEDALVYISPQLWENPFTLTSWQYLALHATELLGWMMRQKKVSYLMAVGFFHCKTSVRSGKSKRFIHVIRIKALNAM